MAAKESGDSNYANACRQAIFATPGTEVVFPEVPMTEPDPASQPGPSGAA
jgi:hypothetical protein